jgi:hypothetical protein
MSYSPKETRLAFKEKENSNYLLFQYRETKLAIFLKFYSGNCTNNIIIKTGHLLGKRSRGRDGRGELTSAQYKPIWNCHSEISPPYNKYVLIKKKKRHPLFRVWS